MIFLSLNQFRLTCYHFFSIEFRKDNVVTLYVLGDFFLCIHTLYTAEDHNK